MAEKSKKIGYAIRPANDRIAVSVIENKKKSAGGIVLPDSAKDRPQRGIVIAVGPGAVLQDGTRGPMDYEIGEEVLFVAYGGVDVAVDEDEIKILASNDILAVVDRIDQPS